MDFNTFFNIQNCFDIVSSTGSILFYSHIPTAIIALILGVIVFRNSQNLIGRLMFFITVFFAIWSMLDLLVWFSYNNSTLLIFAWSLYGIIYGLIFVSSLYFIYAYFEQKDISFKLKSLLSLLLLPFILFLPTNLNVAGYENVGCVAAEGSFTVNYSFFIGIIVILWILILAIRKYLQVDNINQKRQILLMTFGIESFLILFSCVVFFVAYLVDTGYIVDGDYSLDQYALLGMPIFIAFLAYLIVKFKTFNIRLIGIQAIVFGLVTLTASKLFTVETFQSRIITFITFALSAVFGFYLIKNINREIETRKKLEILTKRLEKANEEQSDTLRFITHQINGIFTNTKGALASIIEGQYDPIPENLREMIKNLFMIQSGGVDSVQSFLSTSQVDGENPYSMEDIDFKKIVADACMQLKMKAEKKGIELDIDLPDDSFHINGDKTFLTNAMLNLIDNGLRYTKEGSVKVSLKKENSNLLLTIKDTGVGINEEDGMNMFTKYGRGKNSRLINVDSNGLGLYLVKKIIDAHKGKVWYESKVNEGTVFFVKLPLKED